MPKVRNVQACITAISFPDSLDGLAGMIDDNAGIRDALTDIDTLLKGRPSDHTSWSAPRWIASGDILFFYHTKRGETNAKRLARMVDEGVEVDEDVARGVKRAVKQAALYAGDIFACAQVAGSPHRESNGEGQHFKSTIFAPLGAVHVFANPLPSQSFSSAVTLSTGGTLTPVLGKSFTALKTLLARHNDLPSFLRDTEPGSSGFKNVTQKSWPDVSAHEDCVFLDECQLRSYLLDFLLNEVKDVRTVVHKECTCFRDGQPTGIADYFVCIDSHWIPVEAKLNASTEPNLAAQLQKYVGIDSFQPRRGTAKGKMIPTARDSLCLVADQNGIYVTENGAYVDCGTETPTWHRTMLNHDTGVAIRAWAYMRGRAHPPGKQTRRVS